MEAASDGAAIPAMIEPRTAPTRPTGGATTLIMRPASWDFETKSRSS